MRVTVIVLSLVVLLNFLFQVKVDFFLYVWCSFWIYRGRRLCRFCFLRCVFSFRKQLLGGRLSFFDYHGERVLVDTNVSYVPSVQNDTLNTPQQSSSSCHAETSEIERKEVR